MLGATLLVVAALMVLAAMGIEIGPLIAGAGVVGVAVGFGAQSPGQGRHRRHLLPVRRRLPGGRIHRERHDQRHGGAFSVRSIKLRHALGALHTIPFGALTTITNYSRDWVIDQMMLNVPVRHRSRQDPGDRGGDRQGAGRRQALRLGDHRSAALPGRREVRRFRDPDQPAGR